MWPPSYLLCSVYFDKVSPILKNFVHLQLLCFTSETFHGDLSKEIVEYDNAWRNLGCLHLVHLLMEEPASWAGTPMSASWCKYLVIQLSMYLHFSRHLSLPTQSLYYNLITGLACIWDLYIAEFSRLVCIPNRIIIVSLVASHILLSDLLGLDTL